VTFSPHVRDSQVAVTLFVAFRHDLKAPSFLLTRCNFCYSAHENSVHSLAMFMS